MQIDESDPILVRVENIAKSKGGSLILKGVSLTIERGRVMCLLGPSGAGKSTLLRCINAIENIDSGVIHIDGDPIGCELKNGVLTRASESKTALQRASIGMVFQNFNLFPHMSVLENIINAPMKVKGVSRREATAQATDLLTKVGLLDKINRYPRQLSGGQQQRIAIARALAMKPKLMLFDEPTSALDPHTKDEVLDVLRKLASSGMTMVIVTHEISFARDVSDQIVIMADGGIVEQGRSNAVLASPRNDLTRSFLSKSLERPLESDLTVD
jgi:polar amino acid transport system ATP-binding protein